MSDHDIAKRQDAISPELLDSHKPDSEDGPTFSGVAETIANGLETGESAMDFVSGHDHLTSGVKTFTGMDSGLLSMVAAGGDAFEGVNDLQEGKRAKGVGEVTEAGASAVGGLANAYHGAVEGFAKFGATAEGKEVFEHQAKTTDFIGSTAAGVGDVVGGVIDAFEGYDKFEHSKKIDDQSQGVDEMTKGSAKTLGGVAESITGLTGTESLGLTSDIAESLAPAGELGVGSVASVAGPMFGSFATGVEIGHYGDEETKKLGMYRDTKGNAESASDWAAGQGVAADQWATQHLHSKTLGTIAGAGATGLASIEGAEGAIDGAVTGGALAVGHAAHKLWDWL